jgi:hypothetical protein
MTSFKPRMTSPGRPRRGQTLTAHTGLSASNCRTVRRGSQAPGGQAPARPFKPRPNRQGLVADCPPLRAGLSASHFKYTAGSVLLPNLYAGLSAHHGRTVRRYQKNREPFSLKSLTDVSPHAIVSTI